jgi:ribosomal protein S18 acetylase RimI-like enzyme
MSIIIRQVEYEDFNAIHSLNNRCFSGNEAYDFSVIYFLLSGSTYSYVAANNQNEVVAYIVSKPVNYNKLKGQYESLKCIEDDYIFTICSLAVCEKMRNQGIANQLISQLIQSVIDRNQFKVIGLQVRISNHYAIHLYKKHGFVQKGILREYYKGPVEDAYFMVLNINNVVSNDSC